MTPTGSGSHRTRNNAGSTDHVRAEDAVAIGTALASAAVAVKRRRCKGCGLCVEACKAGAIEMGTDQNWRGYNYPVRVSGSTCTGCANCYEVCPDCAIIVYRKGYVPQEATEIQQIISGFCDEP